MRPLFAHPAIGVQGAAMLRMRPFTALEMFMRPAHPFSLFVVAAYTAAAFTGWAHAKVDRPLASDPAVATAPLHHTALAACGSVETVETDWRSANVAVSAFPRGHADILVWEAAQTHPAKAPTTTAAPVTPPAHSHGMHQHAPARQPGEKP